MDSIAAGSRLGGFTIESQLGRGGMGAVYRARDERGRVVALKVIMPELARDERFLRRFDREARAGAAVSHENVIAVHGLEQLGGHLVLALELLPGGSLADRLKREGKLAWRKAAAIGSKIARGLAAIHAVGIVHRDLKPENVLFDAEGRPKISDFGLAGKLEGSVLGVSRASLTREGDVLGTPEYMSPEQADGREAGPAADLYSLGALLYAAIAGEPPYRGSPMEIVLQHLQASPRPIRELEPGVPAALAALLSRLFEKDPALRGADATRVAAELDAIAATGSSSRARLPLVLGAVAVAIAIAVAAIALRSTAKEPPPVEKVGDTETPPQARRQDEPARPRLDAAATFGTNAWRGASGGLALAVSPDGSKALVGANDPLFTMSLFDLATGKEERIFAGHEQSLRGVAFIGRDRIISADKTSIRLWRADGGGIASFPLAAGSLAVSPDARTALVGLFDGSFRTISLAPGGEKLERDFPPKVTGDGAHSAFLPDGRVLSADWSGKLLWLWDLAEGETIAEARQPGPRTWSVTVSADGRRALTTHDGGVITLWEVPSLRQVWSKEVGHPWHAATRAVFLADGKHALSAGHDSDVRRIDLETGASSRIARATGPVYGLELGTPERAIVLPENGDLQVLDVATGKSLVDEGDGHRGRVSSLAVSKDGRRMLSAGWDGRLELWAIDGASTAPLARLDVRTAIDRFWQAETRESTAATYFVAFRGDRSAVAVGSRVGAVWDLDSREPIGFFGCIGNSAALLGEADEVVVADQSMIRFPIRTVPLTKMLSIEDGGPFAIDGPGLHSIVATPDGRLVLATRWGAAEAQAWRVPRAARPERLATLPNVRGEFATALALSDDGRLAAAGGDARVVQLWDLRGTEGTFTIGARVTAVAFSRDATLLAAGAVDGKVRVFDVAGRRELVARDVEGERESFPSALAFSKDGRRLFAGTGRGTILAFDIIR